MPLKKGKQAVRAVAIPRRASIESANVCSLTKSNILITPTAKNPGISLIVCSTPISNPSKRMTSTTKLFKRADQTENAKGRATAININKASGRLHFGKLYALLIEKSSFIARV